VQNCGQSVEKVSRIKWQYKTNSYKGMNIRHLASCVIRNTKLTYAFESVDKLSHNIPTQKA